MVGFFPLLELSRVSSSQWDWWYSTTSGWALLYLSFPPKVRALPQHDNILQIVRFVGLAMAEPNQKVCDSIHFHQHVKVSLGWILNPKLLLLAVPLVCGCVYECCYWSWWAGGALHGSLRHQCVKWWMHCFSLCVKVCTANNRLQFTAALKSLVWLLYRVPHEDWSGATRRICLPDHNLGSVKTKHVCVLGCHCLHNTLDQRPIIDFVWSANVYLRWPDEKSNVELETSG